MKNTVFPHKFWRPFLDCMPQLFFRPQYVWFPVHLKGHLIPLCYEALVVNWQNWLFTLFHQSRSVLSPNPIGKCSDCFVVLCFVAVTLSVLSGPMWPTYPCFSRLLHRPWWRHQMETFSVLLAICAGNSPVPGEFPAQRPVTRSFDVFFDLRLNKQLSKQWWGWWFETPSRPLWRHCNALG